MTEKVKGQGSISVYDLSLGFEGTGKGLMECVLEFRKRGRGSEE